MSVCLDTSLSYLSTCFSFFVSPTRCSIKCLRESFLSFKKKLNWFDAFSFLCSLLCFGYSMILSAISYFSICFSGTSINVSWNRNRVHKIWDWWSCWRVQESWREAEFVERSNVIIAIAYKVTKFSRLLQVINSIYWQVWCLNSETLEGNWFTLGCMSLDVSLEDGTTHLGVLNEAQLEIYWIRVSFWIKWWFSWAVGYFSRWCFWAFGEWSKLFDWLGMILKPLTSTIHG